MADSEPQATPIDKLQTDLTLEAANQAPQAEIARLSTANTTLQATNTTLSAANTTLQTTTTLLHESLASTTEEHTALTTTHNTTIASLTRSNRALRTKITRYIFSNELSREDPLTHNFAAYIRRLEAYIEALHVEIDKKDAEMGNMGREAQGKRVGREAQVKRGAVEEDGKDGGGGSPGRKRYRVSKEAASVFMKKGYCIRFMEGRCHIVECKYIHVQGSEPSGEGL